MSRFRPQRDHGEELPDLLEALTGLQKSACSDGCRGAWSRRGRAEGQAEKERRVRELLEAALRVVSGYSGG